MRKYEMNKIKWIYSIWKCVTAHIWWDKYGKSLKRKKNSPSILQFSELLLFRDELCDTCEWLWLCESDGLESAERRDRGCRMGPASGLGVTVTIGWTEPYPNQQ